jgi:putative FmdB family regulatory protein
MPIYCYRAVEKEKGCEHCREVFEVTQKMSDAAIEKCPQCSLPVERIVTSFSTYYNRTKEMLSNKNLKEKGFTKLVKEEKGVYRKVT